jgi:hypothetical protein
MNYETLEALKQARIELGAFLQAGAGPGTKRAFDAVCAAIDNYEPPDPPGFEAGFAENH